MMKSAIQRRLLSLVLTVLLLLSAMLPTLSAADTAKPAAQIGLVEDSGILSLSLYLQGEALARTQCIALSFDAAALSLLSHDGMDVPLPDSVTAHPSDGIVTAADGWSTGLSGLLTDTATPALELGKTEENRGILLLYPTADAPKTYAAPTAVLTVRFSIHPDADLTASSVRLVSYEEQTALNQTVKLLLCTANTYETYGATVGGDTLSAPRFFGHPVITGSQDNDTAAPSTAWSNPFVDITEDMLYYDAIAYAAQSGLFVGNDKNEFQPNASMNRATFATVLCRLANEASSALAAAPDETGFTDVRPEDWYAPYVAWASACGLFLGYGDGRFGPDDPITHEQMYVLIRRFTETRGYRVKDGVSASLASLSDADRISDWALDAVRFAYVNGLLIADANRAIRPGEHAARWELAELLQSLAELSSVSTGAAKTPVSMTAGEIPIAPPASASEVRGAVDAIRNGLLTLSEPINLTAYHLNYDQLVSTYHEAATSAEFFYVDNLYYYTYSRTTGEILSVTPTYLMRGTELRAAQTRYADALQNLLSGVDRTWSDIEKILYLHDLLAVTYVYDETVSGYDALTLVTEGRGVCQGYTLLLQALLSALGIENTTVTSDTMNHTWNLVQIGGKWYHIDVTWDDPQPDQWGQVQHLYFLKSDAYMLAHEHTDWYSFAGIRCTDTAYDAAFFNDVHTPFVPMSDGGWYGIDDTNGNMLRWNPDDGTHTAVTKTDIRWTTADGVYRSRYTGLVGIDSLLVYNAQDAIYAYHLDTGVTETVHKTTAVGSVCGLTLEWTEDAAGKHQPYLIYRVCPSPADSTGTFFRVSAANLFTYSLTGAVRGYFADAQTKITLQRNGTTYKTATLPRTSLYAPAEQSFTLEGIKPGRYELVIEKKGCIPYTVKNLSVSANMDLTATLGVLTLLCGDCNGDGAINAADRALLLRADTYRRTRAQAKTTLADCSGDGIIDIVDYAILTAADRYGYDKSMCIVSHTS